MIVRMSWFFARHCRSGAKREAGAMPALPPQLLAASQAH